MLSRIEIESKQVIEQFSAKLTRWREKGRKEGRKRNWREKGVGEGADRNGGGEDGLTEAKRETD